MKKRSETKMHSRGRGGSKAEVEQPQPFTPGVTKAEVRQHAFSMFRDKLPDHPLTLEDWVLAEKDLVKMRQEEETTP